MATILNTYSKNDKTVHVLRYITEILPDASLEYMTLLTDSQGHILAVVHTPCFRHKEDAYTNVYEGNRERLLEHNNVPAIEKLFAADIDEAIGSAHIAQEELHVLRLLH